MSTNEIQHFPFPRLPEAVKTRHSISDLALRPFGIYERDLNVDFIHQPRPFLVTEILDCCTRDANGKRVDRNFIWDLNVGTRTECLLRLIMGDQTELPLSLHCPNDTCGGELELELTTDEISELQAGHDDLISIGKWTLRRPTGNDQLSWLGKSFDSEASALSQIFRTLVVAGVDETDANDALLVEVGGAMEEQDPLVRFTVHVQCPDCEQVSICEIDLEELSLDRLRQAQFRLLAAVHRFAAHYHWSEEEIFKVPYWRRDYYLDLLEREKRR